MSTQNKCIHLIESYSDMLQHVDPEQLVSLSITLGPDGKIPAGELQRMMRIYLREHVSNPTVYDEQTKILNSIYSFLELSEPLLCKERGALTLNQMKVLFQLVLTNPFLDKQRPAVQKQLWTDLKRDCAEKQTYGFCTFPFLHIMGYLTLNGRGNAHPLYKTTPNAMALALFPEKNDDRAYIRRRAANIQEGRRPAGSQRSIAGTKLAELIDDCVALARSSSQAACTAAVHTIHTHHESTVPSPQPCSTQRNADGNPALPPAPTGKGRRSYPKNPHSEPQAQPCSLLHKPVNKYQIGLLILLTTSLSLSKPTRPQHSVWHNTIGTRGSGQIIQAARSTSSPYIL